MTLVPGTRLGHYEVLAPLGAGGMGEVYRARDTRLGRDVAVKLLPPRVAHDPERRARFEREAKTISSLNHPHICTLYDVGEEAFVPGADRSIGRLARVGRRGHVEVLPPPPAPYGQLDLSPDGTRLAVHVADVTDYVWIWDLERSEGRRLTGTSPSGWPFWGPGGKDVVFRSWQAEPPGSTIQAQPADGRASPRTLLQGPSMLGVWADSWVGTKLAVAELTEGGYRSGVLSLDGGATAEWDDELCYFGAISPDGRWLACYREGQVYLRSLSDRAFLRQVSTVGGIEPRWCPAGNQLFFSNGNRFLATSVSFEPTPHWDPPRLVFEADVSGTDGYSYDVSPDDSTCTSSSLVTPDERDRIHFVTGWLDELRTLVDAKR